jgi:hypothetical protein
MGSFASIPGLKAGLGAMTVLKGVGPATRSGPGAVGPGVSRAPVGTRPERLRAQVTPGRRPGVTPVVHIVAP